MLKSAKFRLDKKKLIPVKHENVFNSYEISSKLGESMYSKVYKVTHKQTGAIRAMKRSSDVSNAIRNEFNILRTVSHPNIIEVYEIFFEEGNASLVTEVLSEGSLLEELNKEKVFLENRAKAICHQILQCLNYLHSNNIIHRDVKLDNIMKKGDNSVKLIDFGSSKQVAYFRALNSEVVGSSYYMPPEVLNKKYNHKCDIWSLGIVLFLMLGGTFPFTGKNKESLKKEIILKKLEFSQENWKEVSFAAKDLISKMLDKNADSRLGADECLNHPWFNEIRTDFKENQSILLDKVYKFAEENVLKQALIAVLTVQFGLNSAKLSKLFYDIDENSNGILEKEEFIKLMSSVVGEEKSKEEAVNA